MADESVTLAAPTADDIRRAAAAAVGLVRETPVLSSQTLTERTGAKVALKAENLQRTGSFKLRGALAKIASLDDLECAHGVVAGSAGNHAQAVAYAARARGIRCEVFMPETAPIAKVEAAASLGARGAPRRDDGRRLTRSRRSARRRGRPGVRAPVR